MAEPFYRIVHCPWQVRGLMLGWSLWLLGSWTSVLLTTPPQPAASRMVAMVLIGGMIGYPLLVLTWATWPDEPNRKHCSRNRSPNGASSNQRPIHIGPAKQVLTDCLCICMVNQAVIWPLTAIGTWRLDQAGLLAILTSAWTLIAGAMVAWATHQSRGSRFFRVLAIVICLIFTLCQPFFWVTTHNETSFTSGAAQVAQGSKMAHSEPTTSPWLQQIGPWHSWRELTKPVPYTPNKTLSTGGLPLRTMFTKQTAFLFIQHVTLPVLVAFLSWVNLLLAQRYQSQKLSARMQQTSSAI